MPYVLMIEKVKKNRYAYRLPGGNAITRGESDILLRGIRGEGFYVRDFNGTIGFTIPVDSADCPSPCLMEESCVAEQIIPDAGTDIRQHFEGIDKIVSLISNHSERSGLVKCVLARTDVHDGELDEEKTFESLCEAYPEAFVFSFHTPRTGTWIGASPELLLSRKGDKLTTVALAGTRPAGTSGDWDDKNIREQCIVKDFIVNALKEEDLEVSVAEAATFRAGPVEHIRNVITAHLYERTLASASTVSTLKDGITERIVSRLSPTPALSGFPKDVALRLIPTVENFSRGYYGGCCGPVRNNGENLEVYVNIRSLCARNGKYCLYAGGGIVEGSKPQEEWMETEKKLTTIKSKIVSKTTKYKTL